MRFSHQFIYFVFSLILLSPSAFAQAVREAGDGGYKFVGHGIVSHSRPHCTYTIVRHGLLLTAKHCFTHPEGRGRPVPANALSFSFPDNVEIPSHDVWEVILDEGENDIAWVSYSPAATAGKIELPIVELATDLPTGFFHMPGSPSARNPRPFAHVKDCSLTGRQGYFPPMPRDPGYGGLLIEMECPAWYGQSGSPILQRQNSGNYTLYGVLAHTFDVLADGSIDPEAVEQDELGSFSRRSIFSPIYLRRNFL